MKLRTIIFIFGMFLIIGCTPEEEQAAREKYLPEVEEFVKNVVQEELENYTINITYPNETIEEPTCFDECSTDTCENNDYISCLKKEDGCKNKVNKGIILDKCRVECITDDDCSSNEECLDYKCEIKEIVCVDECFDTDCLGSDFIDCVSKSDGCRDEVNKGKIRFKCGIDCLTDSDCSIDRKCKDYQCVICLINSDCTIDKKCENYECVEIIRTKLELENYYVLIKDLNNSYLDSTKQVVTNTCGDFTIDMDTDEYFVVTKINGKEGETAVLQLSKVHDTNGVTIKDYTGTVIAENKKVGKTFDAADMTVTVVNLTQGDSNASFSISDSLCVNNMIITKDGEKIDIPFE